MTQPAAFYDGRDLESLANLRRYQNWILDHFRPVMRGTIVEYGAGGGNISVLLAQHAEKLQLVEPSPNLYEQLKKRFAHESRVSTHMTGLEEHATSLPDASIDGFVLVNVLEHIEDDENALAQMSRALKPGGHLMLFVPALEFLMSPMDHRLQHKRRYHLRSLCDKVEKAGLGVLKARYMDLLGIAAWWLFHVVGKRTEFNPDMAMLYDRLFVPITRGIETLANPRIGKSLVLVARKP